MDRDEERIKALKSGRMPFYEPDLEELAVLVAEADVVLISVDTPQGKDGSPDA